MQDIKLKLSQFLDIIKSQFDEIIGYNTYIIEAEVKYITQRGNFYYIDLVETKDGKILDSCKSNIFNPAIMNNFLREIGIYNIQELVGKKLLLTVKPTFHRTYNFSVNIQYIHSDFYIGGLELQKKDNISKLKSKGIFYNNKSKEIGEPTFSIAVITGEKSEGYRDFKTILEESGYKYKITEFHSLVHGEKASKEVKKQLENIKQELIKGNNYNLVAIIRGGGGSEGMNWTNDFELCEQVCDFEIPVMTAVGHTVDQSILDMVARYDCKTPSEAAQILIDLYEKYKELILKESEYIFSMIYQINNRYKTELKNLAKNLPLQISNTARIYKQSLIGFQIDYKIKQKSKYLSNNLKYLYTNISLNSPEKILDKGYNLVYDLNGNHILEYEVGKKYKLKSKKYQYEIIIESKNNT